MRLWFQLDIEDFSLPERRKIGLPRFPPDLSIDPVRRTPRATRPSSKKPRKGRARERSRRSSRSPLRSFPGAFHRFCATPQKERVRHFGVSIGPPRLRASASRPAPCSNLMTRACRELCPLTENRFRIARSRTRKSKFLQAPTSDGEYSLPPTRSGPAQCLYPDVISRMLSRLRYERRRARVRALRAMLRSESPRRGF